MNIRDAEITPIEAIDVPEVLSWVNGGKQPSDFERLLPDAKLLALCYDGVVWGYLCGDSWCLSSSAFPAISPEINETNLLEMHIFDNSREIMLWKQRSGIAGRVIRDTKDRLSQDVPFRPLDDAYVLWGSRLLEVRKGFSLVEEPTGVRHVVPVPCTKDDFPLVGSETTGRPWHPLRLDVRWYFSEDEQSGAVHIAASRLFGVRKEAYRP